MSRKEFSIVVGDDSEGWPMLQERKSSARVLFSFFLRIAICVNVCKRFVHGRAREKERKIERKRDI